MAYNILKKADLYNSTDPVGLPLKELTRDELLRLVGLQTGSITVPSLSYVCVEIDLQVPAYCKDFTLSVSSGVSLLYAYLQSDSHVGWFPCTVTKVGTQFKVDFNSVLPDFAQLIYKFRFAYVNLSQSAAQIYSAELLTVDYPIDFDYTRFSVVASAAENAPIGIMNRSIQGTEKDVRVLPIFSNDYSQDCVYMITESGKQDENKYHIQRGFRFPEDAPWDSGRVSNHDTYGWIADGTTNTGITAYHSQAAISNIQPYMLTFSYNYNQAGYHPFAAFDKSVSNTGWHSDYLVTGKIPQWLAITFSGSVVINRYRMAATGNRPTEWTIQGSNDQLEWDILHTVNSGITWGGDYWTQWFGFTNDVPYSTYKLSITAPSGNYLIISELEYVQAQWGVIGNIDEIVPEDRNLTLSDTSTSGTWTSPVVYLPDQDLITMYVYGDDLSDDAYIGKDFKSINSLVEVRSSDTCPEPNFLTMSWTPKLYTLQGSQQELDLAARRPKFLGIQDIPDMYSDFWTDSADSARPCGPRDAAVITPRPFVLGRTKRMYVKGDGTILAQAPKENDETTIWEMGHRIFQLGIPVKEYGDINSFWNAGHFIPFMGSFIPYKTGACTLTHVAAPTLWHRMTFASELDNSDWAQGRAAGSKLEWLIPYGRHWRAYVLGIAQESLAFDILGSYTMAVDSHPNEWINVMADMYPWNGDSDKYMCVYYNHVRNFWAAESKLLGIYGIGSYPCDEGWAVTKCKATNGFWLHVGYLHRIIDKYSMDGDLVYSSRTDYGFSSMKETQDPPGLWAIRNDAVYWYEETDDGLVETFSITDPEFKYLQAGDVDDHNNLWLVDRDSSTVYRINFSSRSIDYSKSIPYTVGVWPHPRDGTAYLYTSFNGATFSTAINKIDMNDPYGYLELIAALPELPISDYSGVQFMGKSMSSYITPSVNDTVWGTDDRLSLDWQPYPNASLTLPGGKYKQFRITLNRESSGIVPPKLSKVRIPKSLVLSKVPHNDSRDVYVNPHLRYNKKYGSFNTELVVWWPH